MRRNDAWRLVGSILAVLAWTASDAWADDPKAANPPVATASDPEDVLRQALELERQRKWPAAIELYEDALQHWPGRTEFRHRLRLCESHYKLGRRYQDPSFRNVLLRLSRDQALALYDELLERIETHYVEPVGIEPLLRRGLDNLEVALRDPTFLQANASTTAAERVQWLRNVYRGRRDQILVTNRGQARAFVAMACEQARQALGIAAAAVILEFTYGACDSLDDYTSYLTPNKLDDLYAMIDGNFVGLGVELKQDTKGLRLVGVIKGGPAWEAGLHAGDAITHVEGKAVSGLGLDEAASRLQGEEGSTAEITVAHPDGSSQTLKLTRRPVEVQSITEAKIVDSVNGVGYIQLTGFQKSSTEELQRAVKILEGQGMRYLVLDVRGNPGGLLNVAVDIADRFLDQGVIVSTRGRAAGQSYVYRARSDNAWRMPLAVLIDRDSASASEILAGALKDHHRATVLGERSYGKGSVQSIFPLKTAPAGLKLTTAKFYSPANRSYSEQGVEPDVVVHEVAKPVAGRDRDEAIPLQELGDPERDAVLFQAIQMARRQLSKAG
jgi:carboxyl-terminal processing protease